MITGIVKKLNKVEIMILFEINVWSSSYLSAKTNGVIAVGIANWTRELSSCLLKSENTTNPRSGKTNNLKILKMNECFKRSFVGGGWEATNKPIIIITKGVTASPTILIGYWISSGIENFPRLKPIPNTTEINKGFLTKLYNVRLIE